MADLDLTGIKTATAGEWITRGDAADLGVPLVRVSDLAEIVRRATSWQPIETAPKDGTVVLLTDSSFVAAGFYASWGTRHPWRFIDSTSEAITCCCDHEEPGRIFSNGWMDGPDGPTHWMPLPEAPK